MGLLKAGAGALGGVLADQWRDFFYCDALDAGTLAAKGRKRTSSRSSNTSGSENIVSDGSIIAVNEGQCMMIVESGAVVEVCAEPGEFLYETSSEPSIFHGDLGESIKRSFAAVGKRFAFGADAPKDQRVYYFNTKEIVGNKYGTASPVPFRVVDNNIGLDVDIALRCNGEYSYRLTDPLLFYKNVCGNVEDPYTRDRIDSQLKSELLTALQPAFARISSMGVRYSAIPGHAAELADILNEELSQDWSELRGISVASFGVNSIAASPEDEAMIKELQKAAVMRDPAMAAANIVAAQSDAMRAAASNENGALMGFMGMGMAGAAGGMNAGNLFQIAQQPAAASSPRDVAGQEAPRTPTVDATAAPQAAKPGWSCSCGASNMGNFCQNCGSKRPENAAWTCACGSPNTGNFCQSCGSARA
ncbi:virion core protein (lumpy skin disease virus) [Paraeggerthella hongkongensis]|uniref:SPFH domain-containing protein n=1 Tax=Paraeggerthella sp. TaxID=2897350 RepID=UPI000DF7EAD7|nr:virion core protein (lumpy skin disease virus) [Paraeggerthella hongkongensis]